MEELRRLRKEKGLSQAKLAVMADLDPSTVSQIETGARRANTRTLERLAAVLETEVADLFPKVQAPLPLEESAAGAPLLEKVLEAARQDAEKNARAVNRLVASEGVKPSEMAVSFAEDKVRTELRDLGFPDEFWEPLLWPLAERVTEQERRIIGLERNLEVKEREPTERLGTATGMRQ